jgi:hypothetical protein
MNQPTMQAAVHKSPIATSPLFRLDKSAVNADPWRADIVSKSNLKSLFKTKRRPTTTAFTPIPSATEFASGKTTQTGTQNSKRKTKSHA